jgi:hypothetical protein
VIDNIVWTDSWLSIAGAGCDLTCVSAGEKQVRKVVAGVNTKIWKGKESDLWVQLDEESVRRKEGFQMNSAEESAVGNSLPFGKETVALILRDCVVTWPERKGQMDG